MNLKVSVVVPVYNGKNLLEKNLPVLLKAAGNKKNNILEVILVDDASYDDSVSFINKNYKSEVKLIKHTKNRGFSAAVNTGVRSSKGDLILLLNTDVLPEEDFLEAVLLDFEDPKVFAVSVHEKGYGSANGYFKDGYIQIGMGEENNKTHLSFYVSGGSGVFRKSVWQELGGMDEKLLSPFYWEDIDLSFRAYKRGYINLWEPKGRVIHNHESTMSTLSRSYVARIRERNQLLCIWKNIHSAALIRKHVVGVISRTLKSPGYLRIVLMALAKLPVALKARKKEIKEGKISDEALFALFNK